MALEQNLNRISPRPEFTTTQWSVVVRAGGPESPEARQALEELCSQYWYPIYAFIRRKGHSSHDAEDLAQDFFAKLLASNFPAQLNPERGRLRSYLLTALNRFLISGWEKAQTQKRGGGASVSSLDRLIEDAGEASYLAELSHNETPEYLFHRAWAQTVLKRVLDQLKDECETRGDTRFSILQPFLGAGDQPPSLETAAQELGLSLAAFKSLLHRFRQRYRQLLLNEVGRTLANTSDAAGEIRMLIASLRC